MKKKQYTAPVMKAHKLSHHNIIATSGELGISPKTTSSQLGASRDGSPIWE